MISSDDRYCPRYCEENIWHLCEDAARDFKNSRVVFISNAERQVAIWQQRAAPPHHSFIVWDYHVILLARNEAGWQVYDADSLLPRPVSASDYLERSFRPLAPGTKRYRPRFRLLEADVYRRELRTDRRHMRRENGDWLSPPPPGPCIGDGSNLMQFVDMESHFLGIVLDLEEFRAFVSSEG